MTAHREVTSICMELRNLLQIMAQLKPHFLQKPSLNHLSPGHSQESLICTPGAPCGIICPSQMDLSLPGTLSSPRSQDQRMAGEQKPSSNLLEQFILLAKGTSGSALTALISQVLEAPGVYVFGELLELANVQECIPYSVLLKDLEMRNLRELEDLIIEAVYTDIIQGKLDQRNQLLEVDFCIGRDIRKKDINNIVKTLHEWCDGCEAVLLGIEQQVLRANQYKENHSRTQQQVEAEVTNIKKTLKATASSSAQEMEQQLAERECPPHAEQRQPTKKMSKVKGLVSSRH
ncbi:COP9 signalosome complex subunit 7b isoform X4 [Lagenorhynchus albirostris]|nr:COP9 signalosome complex subunit 7b isoform X4 [Lagenorhynchus albirostris]